MRSGVFSRASVAYSRAVRPRRGGTMLPELGAQPAQLRFERLDALDEREHDAHAMRVEVELAAQARRVARDDEPARLEGERGRRRIARHERAVLHELGQLGLGQSGSIDELRPRDFPHRVEAQGILHRRNHRDVSLTKCARGSKFEVSASFLYRSLCASSTTLGTSMRTSAYRWPAAPLPRVMPRPDRRSCWPARVPGGTLSVTVPAGVGRSTLVPSTASHGASGRSMKRSLPDTRYNGWSATSMSRYKS